jgi:hypothetical protein
MCTPLGVGFEPAPPLKEIETFYGVAALPQNHCSFVIFVI